MVSRRAPPALPRIYQPAFRKKESERQQVLQRQQQEQAIAQQEQLQKQVDANLAADKERAELQRRYEQGELTETEFKRLFASEFSKYGPQAEKAATFAYAKYYQSTSKNPDLQSLQSYQFATAELSKEIKSELGGAGLTPSSFYGKKATPKPISDSTEKFFIEGKPVTSGFSSITGESVFETRSGRFTQFPAQFEKTPASFMEKPFTDKDLGNALPAGFGVIGEKEGARFTPYAPPQLSRNVSLEKSENLIVTKEVVPDVFDVEEAKKGFVERIGIEVDLAKGSPSRREGLRALLKGDPRNPIDTGVASLQRGARDFRKSVGLGFIDESSSFGKVRVILPDFGVKELGAAGLGGIISGGFRKRVSYEARTRFPDISLAEPTAVLGLEIGSLAVSYGGVSALEKSFFKPSKLSFELVGSRKQIIGVSGSGKGVIEARSTGELLIDRTPQVIDDFVGPAQRPYSIRSLFSKKEPVELYSTFQVRTIKRTVGSKGDVDPLLQKIRSGLEKNLPPVKRSDIPLAISGGAKAQAEAAASKDILKSQLRDVTFEVKQQGIVRFARTGQEVPYGVQSVQETVRLRGFEFGKNVPLFKSVIGDKTLTGPLVDKELLRLRSGLIVSQGAGGKVRGITFTSPLDQGKRRLQQPDIIIGGSKLRITKQPKNLLLEDIEGVGQFRQTNASKIIAVEGKRRGIEILKGKVSSTARFDKELPSLSVRERVITVGRKGTPTEMANQRNIIEKLRKESILGRKGIQTDPVIRERSIASFEKLLKKQLRLDIEQQIGRKISDKQFAKELSNRLSSFKAKGTPELLPKGIPEAKIKQGMPGLSVIELGPRKNISPKNVEPFQLPKLSGKKKTLQESLFELSKREQELSLGRKLTNKQFLSELKRINVPIGKATKPSLAKTPTLQESFFRSIKSEKEKSLGRRLTDQDFLSILKETNKSIDKLPPRFRPEPESLESALFKLSKSEREKSLGRSLTDDDFLKELRRINVPQGLLKKAPPKPKQSLSDLARESLKKELEKKKKDASFNVEDSFKFGPSRRETRLAKNNPYYIPPVETSKEASQRIVSTSQSGFGRSSFREVPQAKLSQQERDFLAGKIGERRPDTIFGFTRKGVEIVRQGLPEKDVGLRVKDIFRVGRESQPVQDIARITGQKPNRVVKELQKLRVEALSKQQLATEPSLKAAFGTTETGRPAIAFRRLKSRVATESALVHEFEHAGERFAGISSGRPVSGFDYLSSLSERRAFAVQERFLESRGKTLPKSILFLSDVKDPKLLERVPRDLSPLKSRRIDVQSIYAQAFKTNLVTQPKPLKTVRGRTGLFIPPTILDKSAVRELSAQRNTIGLAGAPLLQRPTITRDFTKERIVVRQPIITKPIVRGQSVPLTISSTRPATLPIVRPISVPRQTPRSVPRTTPATIPSVIPTIIPTTTPTTIPKITPIPIPLPRPIPTLVPRKLTLPRQPNNLRRLKPGFFPVLYRKGKPIRRITSQPLTFGDALAAGSSFVDRTIKRSFKLIKSNQLVEERNLKGPSFILRRGKRDPFLFVEKSRFAISTKGEKDALRVARNARVSSLIGRRALLRGII